MPAACKSCPEQFETDSELLSHIKVHQLELCIVCQKDLGPHVCTGRGADGFEHNFCLKVSNSITPRHFPHPRICHDCELKHQEKWSLIRHHQEELEKLREREAKITQIIEELRFQVRQESPHEVFIKMFCGHGLPKGECKLCEQTWQKFDANRAVRDQQKTEPPKPAPLTRMQKAKYIVIP